MTAREWLAGAACVAFCGLPVWLLALRIGVGRRGFKVRMTNGESRMTNNGGVQN